VHLFCVCVVLCVGSGIATGSSPVKGVLPTVYRIKKLRKRSRPNKGLQSHNKIKLKSVIGEFVHGVSDSPRGLWFALCFHVL
jgi:hypothetical protein